MQKDSYFKKFDKEVDVVVDLSILQKKMDEKDEAYLRAMVESWPGNKAQRDGDPLGQFNNLSWVSSKKNAYEDTGETYLNFFKTTPKNSPETSTPAAFLKPNPTESETFIDFFINITTGSLGVSTFIFFYAVLVLILTVVYIRLATPSSTLANEKHNEDVKSRKSSQTLANFKTKTNQLLFFFTKNVKKIFKR